MKSFETTLTERGITTVPKTLREALGALGGGRLIWRLTLEGALEVRLKHVYPGKLGSCRPALKRR